MSAATDRLTAAVTHLSTVTDSAVALVGTLAQQIRDNIGDDDALNELADSIEGDANELAAAVTANTPASGEAPADPGAPADPTDAPAVAAGNGDPVGEAAQGEDPTE